MTRCLSATLLLIVASAFGAVFAHAQHHGEHHPAEPSDRDATHHAMPLQAPGHAIFGTVQEAIQALEADSTTDWSAVDMEVLRQHLIDMHHVAMNVSVDRHEAIDGGVRLVVRPTSDAADEALQRVLAAHPSMLQQETGWEMEVTSDQSRYVLQITDPEGAAADKIRGLGYIGLLAYGPHHQHHHWMMVRGQSPHAH